MNKSWLLVGIVLSIVGLLLSPAWAEQNPTWNIDEVMKFHFAFFTPQEPASSEKSKFLSVPPVLCNPASKDFGSDIENIDLDAICNLDFPLPNRNQPGKFLFHLKFFSFPENICSCISSKKVMDDYLFAQIPGYPNLRKYLIKKENLLVKKGYVAPTKHVFTKETPYPPLLIPQRMLTVDGRKLNAQEYFDNHLPFVSLYLTPVTKEPQGVSDTEKANWSTEGIRAFHRDLLSKYRTNLEKVSGKDPENNEYFRAPGQNGKKLVIFRVPKEIMVFNKVFKGPAFPQDPYRIFLSGLLLLYRNEYDSTGAGLNDFVVDSESFKSAYRLTKAQLMEIVSVVKFQDEHR